MSKIERPLKISDLECYQLVYNARVHHTTIKPTESTPDNTNNR